MAENKQQNQPQETTYTIGHKELMTLYNLAKTGLVSQSDKLDDQTNAVCWNLINAIGNNLRATIANNQEQAKSEQDGEPKQESKSVPKVAGKKTVKKTKAKSKKLSDVAKSEEEVSYEE